MLPIRSESQEIELGLADAEQNVLLNAPHTAAPVTADTWTLLYSREQADFPVPRRSTLGSISETARSRFSASLSTWCPPNTSAAIGGVALADTAPRFPTA